MLLCLASRKGVLFKLLLVLAFLRGTNGEGGQVTVLLMTLLGCWNSPGPSASSRLTLTSEQMWAGQSLDVVLGF